MKEQYMNKIEKAQPLAHPLLIEAKSWSESCDFCKAQEKGGHYCLLHSIILKNANLLTCSGFDRK